MNEKAPPPIFFTKIPLDDRYLGEYLSDYLYRRTKDVLPDLESYVFSCDIHGGTFLGSLMGAMIRNKETDKIKKFRNHEAERLQRWGLYSLDARISFAVVINGTFEDVVKVDGFSHIPKFAKIGIPVTNSEVYFALVALNPLIFAGCGYKALEPEEYIKYLETLAANSSINIDLKSTFMYIIRMAEKSGYTYTSLFFKEYLSK